jgi:hypothetical protein
MIVVQGRMELMSRLHPEVPSAATFPWGPSSPDEALR